MLKIRLVTFYEAPDCWDITSFLFFESKEVDEQLEEYVDNNINNITAPGFEIEDFEVPDNLTMSSNKQFIVDICQGKSFGIWSYKNVDFNSEYYQNWIYYKNKENVWTKFG